MHYLTGGKAARSCAYIPVCRFVNSLFGLSVSIFGYQAYLSLQNDIIVLGHFALFVAAITRLHIEMKVGSPQSKEAEDTPSQ
jgi:hypothetical protein